MSSELEQHRFSFEGSTSLMARHLVDDHGVPATTISCWANGLDQGSWVALDDLHKEAHMRNELREAAQRVTGYVRARALLSNVDPEVVGDIAIMPGDTKQPMEFQLLAADLEALAAHALLSTPQAPASVTSKFTVWPEDSRCALWVPDISGISVRRICGLKLGADGTCPRPKEEHSR